MSQLPRRGHDAVVTKGAQRNDFKPWELDHVPRVYFFDNQDANEIA